MKSTLPVVQTWKYIFDGGKGAPAGDPGQKGSGGKGGPQGDRNDPCPSRPEYAGTDGPNGQTMDEIDSNWPKDYAGPDGADGDLALFEIDVVPS